MTEKFEGFDLIGSRPHDITMQTFYDQERFIKQFGRCPIGRKKRLSKRHDHIEHLTWQILAKNPIPGLMRITIVNEQDAMIDGLICGKPARFKIDNFMEDQRDK